MRRLSGALETLLDPLDPAGSLAEPSEAPASREATGSAGTYRTEQRFLINDAEPGQSDPRRRHNPFERMVNAVERFRWRQAHAKYSRRHGQASRHRVARSVLTIFVVCLVLCAVSFAVVALVVR
jgi:hypothetical protein